MAIINGDTVIGKEASSKSRLWALVLAILLGLFGIHRFYVGKSGTGLVLLLLTLTGLGAWVSGMIVLCDIIMIACGQFEDKQERLLLRWDDAVPV